MHRERMQHRARPWDLRNNFFFFSTERTIPITARSQGHHRFSILGAIQNKVVHYTEQFDLAGLVLRKGKPQQLPEVLPTCIILWFVTQVFSNPKFQYLHPTFERIFTDRCCGAFETDTSLPPKKKKKTPKTLKIAIHYIICLVSHQVHCVIQPEIAGVNSMHKRQNRVIGESK